LDIQTSQKNYSMLHGSQNIIQFHVGVLSHLILAGDAKLAIQTFQKNY
jgi:hypothetical protein